MKKKLILFSSVILLAIGGVVYGLNSSATSNNTIASYPDCSKKECCVKSDAKALAINKDDCPLAGTPDCPLATAQASTACPMIGECCKNH